MIAFAIVLTVCAVSGAALFGAVTYLSGAGGAAVVTVMVMGAVAGAACGVIRLLR